MQTVDKIRPTLRCLPGRRSGCGRTEGVLLPALVAREDIVADLHEEVVVYLDVLLSPQLIEIGLEKPVSLGLEEIRQLGLPVRLEFLTAGLFSLQDPDERVSAGEPDGLACLIYGEGGGQEGGRRAFST